MRIKLIGFIDATLTLYMHCYCTYNCII